MIGSDATQNLLSIKPLTKKILHNYGMPPSKNHSCKYGIPALKQLYVEIDNAGIIGEINAELIPPSHYQCDSSF